MAIRRQLKCTASRWVLNCCIVLVVLCLEPLTGIAQEVYGDSAATISFRSLPDSVAVSLDSVLLGTTPCQFKAAPLQAHLVTYSKLGFRSRADTLTLHSTADTIISIRLYKPGTVHITSAPDSAAVYIGTDRVGYTPLFLSNLPHDSMMLSVRKPQCEPWRMVLVPGETDTMHISARLNEHSARMSVLVDPGHTRVFVDDRFVVQGSLVNFTASEGPHKITVRDDSTGRTTDYLTYNSVGSNQVYQARLGVNSLQRGFLTAVIPGSAQMIDGAFLEGTALLVGNVALAYFAVQSQADYRDRLEAYDIAVKNYIAAPTEDEAFRRHDDVSGRKSDLDKSYARRTVSFALFASAYVYALADALLHHIVTDTIEVVPMSAMSAPSLTSSSEHPVGAQIRVKF